MRWFTASALAFVAFGASGCGADRAVAPALSNLKVPAITSLRSGGTLQDPIVVTIDGPGRTTEGGPWAPAETLTWTASASGGTAPYYFVWKVRQCQYVSPSAYIECWPDHLTYAQGWNGSTFSWYFDPSLVKIDLHVEVREAPDGYVTGYDAREVPGQSYYQLGYAPDYGDPLFRCSGGAYLFDEWRFTEGTWVTTGRKYRRNSCDGSREYSP